MSLLLEALKRSRKEKTRSSAREKSGYALEPVFSALGYSEGEDKRDARRRLPLRFAALILVSTLLAGPALIAIYRFDLPHSWRGGRPVAPTSVLSAMKKIPDDPEAESAPPAGETTRGNRPLAPTAAANRPLRIESSSLEAAVPKPGLKSKIQSPKPRTGSPPPERTARARFEPALVASGTGAGDGKGETESEKQEGTGPTEKGNFAGAARLPPSDLELAVFYHKSGDILKASEAYRKLLAADPFNHEAHDNFGLLLQEIGKYDEAIEEHKKAIVLRPDSAKAYNNLGFAYLNKGQLSQARENFERALRLDPYNQAAQNNLALVYLRQGSNEQAKNALIKLLGINPRHPHAHYNLALIYDEEGAISRAVEHYRSFLEHAGAGAVAGARSDELLAEVRRRIAELEAKKP